MKVITDDGKEYEVESEVFRKIFSFAMYTIIRIKKEEGKLPPGSEAKAEDFIYTLQSRHIELI